VGGAEATSLETHKLKGRRSIGSQRSLEQKQSIFYERKMRIAIPICEAGTINKAGGEMQMTEQCQFRRGRKSPGFENRSALRRSKALETSVERALPSPGQIGKRREAKLKPSRRVTVWK
jgi:hypothetical protein